jgi:hypothetical protein
MYILYKYMFVYVYLYVCNYVATGLWHPRVTGMGSILYLSQVMV